MVLIKKNYIEYESKGDKDKNLLPKKYLDMIRPYLSDIINDHKTQEVWKAHSGNKVTDCKTTLGEWKIQLSMKTNCESSKDDSDEIRKMHTKSHNVEIMMGSETNEIIEELFESLLQNYQNDLEKSMKGSEFTIDSIDLLYYNLNKISLGRKGRSYIDSPKWLKNKKATINPKNNDNNCFQYALTVALNYQSIKKDPQRISKIKPFINQYNWKEIDFPAQPSKDWKKFESNNKSIALNVLYIPYNTEKIKLAYKSKYNFKRENQVILLMITDGKKCHYFSVKSLSALFRRIIPKHVGDFYCLNCFHLYSIKNKLKKHERLCNDHDYFYVEMSNDNDKILKYNQGGKSIKVPSIIYADLECLLKKCTHAKTILKNHQQKKKTMHIPPGYSFFKNCSFDPTKNKLDCYKGEDCMEKFCKDLREHATKTINYEKKEMIQLTDK